MIETLSWTDSALMWFEKVQTELNSTDTLTRLDAEGKVTMSGNNLQKAVTTVAFLNNCLELEID